MLQGVEISLGYKCNSRCRYCLQGQEHTKEMPYNPKIIPFIQKLKGMLGKDFRVAFIGGEPLLYWDRVVTIAKTLGKIGYKYSINTNCLTITEEQIDFLNDYGFTVVTSYDGPRSKECRGNDLLEGRRIPLLLKINSLAINCLVSAYAYPKEIIEGLSDFFCKYVATHTDGNIKATLNNLVVTKPVIEVENIDRERLSKEMKLLWTRYLNNRDKGYTPNDFLLMYLCNSIERRRNRRKGIKPECHCGETLMNIGVDGQAYACHNIPEPICTIDDYGSYRHLAGRYFNEIGFDRSKCQFCSAYEYCRGGCRSQIREWSDWYCNNKRAFYAGIQEANKEYLWTKHYKNT